MSKNPELERLVKAAKKVFSKSRTKKTKRRIKKRKVDPEAEMIFLNN